MKYTTVAVVLILAGLFVLLRATAPFPEAAAQPAAGAPELSPKVLAFLKAIEPAPGDSELRQKLKERHNAAVRLLDERVKEYKKGLRDAGPVFEAARLAAEAKLDLAENAEERTAALDQALEVARVIETYLQKQLDAGFGSRGDLERARYNRLSVEVELLKAKQKGDARPQ
jgi:hypothetical protein